MANFILKVGQTPCYFGIAISPHLDVRLRRRIILVSLRKWPVCRPVGEQNRYDCNCDCLLHSAPTPLVSTLLHTEAKRAHAPAYQISKAGSRRDMVHHLAMPVFAQKERNSSKETAFQRPLLGSLRVSQRVPSRPTKVPTKTPTKTSTKTSTETPVKPSPHLRCHVLKGCLTRGGGGG